MKRKPLSPEAKAAAIERLNDVMRKACERMETNKSRRQSELDSDELAEALGKIADEMGANI